MIPHVAELSKAASSRPRFHFGLAASFALGLVGQALLLAALPPAGLWIFGWLSPVPWLVLASQDRVSARSVLGMWLASFLFYGIYYSWMGHVSPAAVAMIIVVSALAGVHLPLVVGLARAASKARPARLLLAAPVAAAAVDFAQDLVMPGISTSTLAMSQYLCPPVLQIAAVIGLHGLTFIMVLAAAGAYLAWLSRSFFPALASMGAVMCCWGYGAFALSQDRPDNSLQVFIIQSAVDRETKGNPDMEEAVVAQYVESTRQACAAGRGDLVIWPETAIGPGMDIGRVARDLAGTDEGALPAVLAGAERHVDRNGRSCELNSAVLLAGGKIAEPPYDKMGLMPFAEALPLADSLPWPRWARALSFNRCAGTERLSFTVNRVVLIPAICYEAGLPRFIAASVRAVRMKGGEPGMIVVLGNLNWFRGSRGSELLCACAVLRAVENHLPVAVAANKGHSIIVDAHGRVRAGASSKDWVTVTGPSLERE